MIAGVHLEGLFLFEARGGAPTPTLLRDLVEGDVAKVLSDAVKMVTIAPELAARAGRDPSGRRRGRGPALGHTDATYEQMIAARTSARRSRPTVHGMRPFHHAIPVRVGVALNDPRCCSR